MSGPESIAGLAADYLDITRRLVVLEQVGDAFEALSTLGAQIPGAEDAGITRVRGGKFETIAATSALPPQVDAIQYALSSGPCVDAVLERTTFRTGDLRSDPRWPEFGRRAYEATGVLSMLSVRLYLEDDANLLVGLNMYSTESDAFDEASELTGILLATHGSLAVASTRARERAANLDVALENRTEIGIGMGVLMAQHKVTREDAFNLLRVASQHTGRKLHDLASEVADTGILPLPSGKSKRTR